MWFFSKHTCAHWVPILVGGILLAALAGGCMADPASGDLPWAKQETWEGTPALPSGMFQPR